MSTDSRSHRVVMSSARAEAFIDQRFPNETSRRKMTASMLTGGLDLERTPVEALWAWAGCRH